MPMRSKARRVLLERDARQPGDDDLPFTYCGKRGRAHARATHKGPLQAVRYRAMRPLRECVCVQVSVARCIVGLPHIAKARSN